MLQFRHTARPLLRLAVLVLMLLGAGRTAQAAQKHLIFQQWGGVPVGDMVRDRGHLEGVPFDGVTVSIPASSQLMLGHPVSYDEMRRQLAPMRGFSRTLTRNFVVVHTRRPPDVFDDWTTLVQSWRALARAAAQAGLAGIFFDNEEYKERTWRYPRDIKYPRRSLSEYHGQVRLRGRQVMEAVTAEFPDAVVLTFHGPYISDPRTPSAIVRSQAVARAEDLRGSFFVGMVEGAGPRVTVVDGGECYQYRSAADFDQSYQWRKYGIAREESLVLPARVRSTWPSRVSIAFAVYNKQPFAKYPMNADIMRGTLATALRRSDRYVWFYVEGDWAQQGVPRDWAQAIREGVASGTGGAIASTQERPEPRAIAREPGGPRPPHALAVTVSASARRVVSGGHVALSASAIDSEAHTGLAWRWSDGGAGGTFSPSAKVRNPRYTAPRNTSGRRRAVTLTATAICKWRAPWTMGSRRVTLTVTPAR